MLQVRRPGAVDDQRSGRSRGGEHDHETTGDAFAVLEQFTGQVGGPQHRHRGNECRIGAGGEEPHPGGKHREPEPRPPPGWDREGPEHPRDQGEAPNRTGMAGFCEVAAEEREGRSCQERPAPVDRAGTEQSHIAEGAPEHEEHLDVGQCVDGQVEVDESGDPPQREEQFAAGVGGHREAAGDERGPGGPVAGSDRLCREDRGGGADTEEVPGGDCPAEHPG